VDLDGNLVTDRSFVGKWTLLYFGFARCPDICPSEMLKMGQLLEDLKQDRPDLAKQIKPIFVTVDPGRDSVQMLRNFAKDFHPDFIFLTGSPQQIEDVLKLYRVYVSKAEDDNDDGNYLLDHSIVVYFHENDGRMIDIYTQSVRTVALCEDDLALTMRTWSSRICRHLTFSFFSTCLSSQMGLKLIKEKIIRLMTTGEYNAS
jgi:protein SCO1/2